MTSVPSGFSLYNRALAERRRNTVDRIDDMTAKDTTIYGRTPIVGLGEITVHLPFPVMFSNKPIITYGADLDDQPPQTVVVGRAPKLDAIVIEWDTVRAVPGAFDGYYIGCTVELVVEGADHQQRLNFNWAFREQAIRNPGGAV